MGALADRADRRVQNDILQTLLEVRDELRILNGRPLHVPTDDDRTSRVTAARGRREGA